MRLPDTNLLVYAVAAESPNHDVARHWLETSLERPQGVALAWLALVGFVRIATNARFTTPAISLNEAVGLVDGWLCHPRVRIVHPGDRHSGLLGRLLIAAGTAGNLTNDAHLAALAIEHNAEVGTFDRDFKRFPGVRLQLLSRN